jgi:hypothetical protein
VTLFVLFIVDLREAYQSPYGVLGRAFGVMKPAFFSAASVSSGEFLDLCNGKFGVVVDVPVVVDSSRMTNRLMVSQLYSARSWSP